MVHMDIQCHNLLCNDLMLVGFVFMPYLNSNNTVTHYGKSLRIYIFIVKIKNISEGPLTMIYMQDILKRGYALRML